MALYKLNQDGSVVRTSDGVSIPNDGGNADWRDYQAWLALGNTPDPYVAPPPPDPSDTFSLNVLKLLYNVDARLRILESRPAITFLQFKNGVKAIVS